jgi:hypothetical protein
MELGDFVKGKPESDQEYGITTSRMTRGVVTKIESNTITVKVLEHKNGGSGKYRVDPKFFEVIGHIKPFNRSEVLELLKNGCKKAILDYDLSEANLSEADLSKADLREANLSKANLSKANLSKANLSKANLSKANLSEANLGKADLSEANLREANLGKADLSEANLGKADLSEANLSKADLDFSCLPLRCGGLKWHIDKRLACQLAYHLCSMQCDDAEYIKMRNILLPFANQFHRVGECGVLEPIVEEVSDETKNNA